MAVRGPPAEWAATEAALVAVVLDIRRWARGRDADLHVVVIQTDRDAPSPGGGRGGSGATAAAVADERAAAETLSERLTALRRRAGLDGSAVTALYRSDVSGALGASVLVAGLDAALRDRALGYYRSRARHAKAVLTRLTLPSQGGLTARLLFKIAHFCEFRGKTAKALKYYSLSYAALVTFAGGVAGTGCPPALRAEARAVAEFANFKIMRIYLAAGTNNVTTPSGMSGLSGAQAAIMQFAAHLRAWEDAATARKGLSDAYAPAAKGWISRQYVLAAELLQLNLSRPTLETRANHVPEHYYHTAALWAVRRRKDAEAQGALTHGSLVLGPAAVAAEAELLHWHVVASPFIGGTPLLAPIAGAGPPTRPREVAVNAMLIVTESRFAHADTVISLLEKAQATAIIDGGTGSASRALSLLSASGTETNFDRGSSFAFFLAATSSRARLWRQWLIADEVAARGDVTRALKLLAPIAALLRVDPWASRILASVATRMRTAASVCNSADIVLVSAFDEIVAAVAVKNDTLIRELIDVMQKAAKSVGASAAANVYAAHIPWLAIDGRAWRGGAAVSPITFSEALVSSRKTSGAVIASSVCFSQRTAPGGTLVAVRILIASLLPDSLPLSRVDINFGCVEGDLGLAAEGGGALPSASSVSMDLDFSVAFVNWDGKEGTLPTGSMLADAPDATGVIKVPLATEVLLNGLQQPRIIAIRNLAVGPANAPALCIEYVVRAPTAPLGLGADVSSALSVLISEANTAALDEGALVEASGALSSPEAATTTTTTTSVAGPLKRKIDVNLTCTDPAAMAGVAQGSPMDVTAAAKVLHSAQQDAHERTIFCSGIRCTATAGFTLHMLPTRLGAAAATELIGQQTVIGRRGASVFGNSLIGTAGAQTIESYLGAHMINPDKRIALVINSIATATPACVAHLTRFSNGSGLGSVAAQDEGVVAISTGVKNASKIAATKFPDFSVSPKVSHFNISRASSLRAPMRDGRVCGHAPAGAHVALVVTEAPPDASLTICDGSNAPIITTAGMDHSFTVTVSNGRMPLLGGAVFLGLSPCNISHFAAGNLADVSLDDASRESAAAGVAAAAAAAVAAADKSRDASPRDEIDVPPTLKVPAALLVIAVDGTVSRARSSGSGASEDLVELMGARGIAIPPLPPGVSYTFTVAVAFAGGAGHTRALLTARLRIAHDDDSAQPHSSSTTNPAPPHWVRALLEKPYLHRAALARCAVVVRCPLELVSATITPDANAPLFDLSPLLLRPPPFSRLRPSPDVIQVLPNQPIYSLLPLTALPGGATSPRAGHVRIRSIFRLSITFRSAAATSLVLTGARLEPAMGSSTALEWLTDSSLIFSQLSGTLLPLDSNSSPLLVAAFNSAATTPRVLLEPGGTANLTLMGRINTVGEWDLGQLDLTWAPHGVNALPRRTRLQLPRVAVHDPPVTCDLTLPLVTASTRDTVSLSVRLSNRTAHFVALEAAAYAPNTLAIAGARSSDTITAALPPLAAAPPTAFSVELLPGASKSVSIALPLRALAGYSGPVALPGFTVRVIEASGAGVSGVGTLPPEPPILAERRTLLALASATMFLEPRVIEA